MRQPGRRPRGAHDPDVGERLLLVERVERGGGSLWVAHDGLVHALGQQQVGDRIEQVVELHEQAIQVEAVGGADRQRQPGEVGVRVGPPGLKQGDPVHHVPRGDRLDARVAVGSGAGVGDRGELSHGEDVLRERHPAVSHAALEPVPEQRADGLAPAYALQQVQCAAYPRRAEVHGQGAGGRLAACDVARTQDRGGGRVRHRRARAGSHG